MRHLRFGFTTPVHLNVALQNAQFRSDRCDRRQHHACSRTVVLSRAQPSSSPNIASEHGEQPSQTVKGQECISAFLKQLQQTHTALQDRRPPDPASVEPLLSSFKGLCLEIQASIDRSLPGMSYLDRAISMANDDATSHRELARLLNPTGPLRTLCGAASAALSQVSISAEHLSTADEPLVPMRVARAAVIRHASLRLRGATELRNAAWRALPWEAMRAHPAILGLPDAVSIRITGPDQLCLLSQDGQAFAQSRAVFPVRADNVWRLLGFGEDEAVAQLGDLLPASCRGHRHALEGWQAFFGGGKVRRDSFDDKFETMHVPNGVLSYLAAARERFEEEFSGRAQWVWPVRVRETGLVVAGMDRVGPVVASPVGRVARRRREDFWAWREMEEGLVLAKTERAFRVEGVGVEFEVVRARRRLDAVSFVEAQMSLLVCGESFEWCDVVWHAVLGGTRTFRVRRDERVVELLRESVSEFCEQFVGERPRPPERGFVGGKAFEELVERVRKGCEGVECVYEVRAEVDEMRIQRWRENFGEWAKRRSEMPFLRAKRE